MSDYLEMSTISVPSFFSVQLGGIWIRESFNSVVFWLLGRSEMLYELLTHP